MQLLRDAPSILSENRIDSTFHSRGEEVLGGSNLDAPLDIIAMGGRVTLDTRIRHSGTLKIEGGRVNMKLRLPSW